MNAHHSGVFIFLIPPDPPDGVDWKPTPDSFSYGSDLVRHIRLVFGDYFTICVAGKRVVVRLNSEGKYKILHIRNKSPNY